jgi:hypothetical protein
LIEQNPINHNKPINVHVGPTKGWWRYYVAVLVGGAVLGVLCIGYRIAQYRPMGVGKNTPFLWRRFKRIIGLKR